MLQQYVAPAVTNLEVYLFDPRVDYRNICCLNLLVYTQAKIKIFDSFDALKEALEENVPDSIIVYVTPELASIDPDFHLIRILKLKNASPHVTLIGMEKSDYKEVSCFPSKVAIKEIIRTLAQKCGITAQTMSKLQIGEYYALPQDFFLPGWQSIHNLYFINPEETSEKPQLALKAGELITKEFLEKSAEKKYFAVKSTQRLELVNSFTSRMTELLLAPNQTLRERTYNVSKAYDMIAEGLKNIGLPETTAKVSKAAISSMEEVVGKISQLKELLDNMQKDQASLRYKHSVITCFVGTRIIELSENDTKEYLTLWTYLCFFHDMFLEKDEWVWVDHSDELVKLNATEKEKQIIVNHARLAAKVLSQYKELPPGLDTLVKQHHGSKMGDKLDSLSLGISPLAILFIVVEEWTKEYLNFMNHPEKRFPYEKFVEYLYKKYPYPVFKKYLIHFKNIAFGSM